MNTSPNPPDLSATGATPALPRPRAGAIGPWVAWMATLLAVLALLLSVWLWQRFGAAQQELARRSQTSALESGAARRVAGEAEALVQELQARLSVAEARLSEVSLQRTQLDELMLSLSRSRDDNLVHDLESGLRLAQQQMQMTGDAQPLLVALQAADARITRAAQPRLNPVQRAIERDIERIQSTPMADLPGLTLLLDELTRQVGDWPLVADPVALAKGPPALVPDGNSALASGDERSNAAAPPLVEGGPERTAQAQQTVAAFPPAAPTEPAAAQLGEAASASLRAPDQAAVQVPALGTPAPVPALGNTGEAAAQAPPPAAAAPSASVAGDSGAADGVSAQLGRGWQRVSSSWRNFWSRVWQSVTQSGRELVRVTRIEHPEAALLAPEQAVYLRENLKLQLLNAKLGVLARQWPSVQHDVLAVEQVLTRYFDQQSPSVVRTLRTLQGLRADLLNTELPRADESLTALAAAAGGR